MPEGEAQKRGGRNRVVVVMGVEKKSAAVCHPQQVRQGMLQLCGGAGEGSAIVPLARGMRVRVVEKG